MSFELLSIELTNKCNLNCIHCFREKGNLDYLNPTLLKRILLEAKAYNLKHVALTGGECTLHPQFFNILDIITEMDYTYHFVTNGQNFNDIYPQLLFEDKPLRKEKLMGVSLSIDGAEEITP